MRLLFFAFAFILTFCQFAYGDGEWYDPFGYDFNSNAAEVTSETSSGTRSDGSQFTSENTTGVDVNGNRMDVSATETTHPDGSVTSRQETTHTDPFGNSTGESSTWKYDSEGNLIEETHSDSKGEPEKPHPADEGLETETTENPGTPEESRRKTTYGKDKIKQTLYNGTEDVSSLSDGSRVFIDDNSGSYYSFGLYDCEELMEQTLNEHGSVREAAEKSLKSLDQAIASMPECMAEKLILQKKKMQESLEKAIIAAPEDLKVVFTQEEEFIGSALAEKVLVMHEGKLYMEVWISKTVSPLAFMDFERLTQRAKDKFFAGPNPTPKKRRIFSRLPLKIIVYNADDTVKNTKVVTKVKRRKLSPKEFAVPEGYELKERGRPRVQDVGW
jgi:YD repeat-containing protein